MQETLLSYDASAGIIADGSQDTFELKPYHFNGNGRPTIYAEGLADAETINFWIPKTASTWRKLYDAQSTPAEVIIDPANNKNSVTFNSPMRLGITKTDNAAATKLVVRY